MKILVACETSGRVRDAFLKLGHEAVSCDILPSDSEGPHIQDDVMNILNDGWDMMIAHPPCTRLCNSGVRWLGERNLWAEMKQSAEFFKHLLDFDKIPLRAIENPVMHKYAKEIIGSEPSQYIQPWQFGHGETKKTGLWLRGLPNLIPTNICEGREQKIWKMPPSQDRWKERSKTYQGIADAMANQWSNP